MKHANLLALAALSVLLTGCDNDSESQQYGSDPQLPAPQRGLLPAMNVAEPAEWGDRLPTVPQGYAIAAIATGLRIPRQTLVLPNGDILVAEGRGGSAPLLTPKDVIAGIIKARGTSPVASGDRLTLLRDTDGKGTYRLTVFADNLNAPYGLALIGNQLYVANQDALVRFEYRDGQTQAAGPPITVTALPSKINHHWTKSLAASADGKFLYVGIGSNSNITERGMTAEADRALVWQVDAHTGAHRPYATGLRNPTGWQCSQGPGSLTVIGVNTWTFACVRRIRRRSPPRFRRTTAWDRMSLLSAWPFPSPCWGQRSLTACSLASMAAGTGLYPSAIA